MIEGKLKSENGKIMRKRDKGKVEKVNDDVGRKEKKMEYFRLEERKIG